MKSNGIPFRYLKKKTEKLSENCTNKSEKVVEKAGNLIVSFVLPRPGPAWRTGNTFDPHCIQ